MNGPLDLVLNQLQLHEHSCADCYIVFVCACLAPDCQCGRLCDLCAAEIEKEDVL